MRGRRILAVLLLAILAPAGGMSPMQWAAAQPALQPAAMPPNAGGPPAPAPAGEPTPPRVSYTYGEVSFWRPGAQDWTAATVNTPLAAGDVLYAGQAGNVEIQIGPRAFARAGYDAQIGLDNLEAGFIQLRLTGGEVALDLRALPAGTIVELDTPNAAFSVGRAGYYRAEVGQDATTFAAYRGGAATMTPAAGGPTTLATGQQVVITGVGSPEVAVGAAAPLGAWDNWNAQRSEYLLHAESARYVPSGVYGTEALDQHGTWRTMETYGSVWVPSDVPTGWVPYSTGQWIWDPRFGWTWLDAAPWGWAPYHYGRWVFVGGTWAWAPGPVLVRPAYAPALVVFLGGPVVAVGRPLYWAPLGWGEPVVPWWGRPGFVGVAWWGGWGGPRVVNNVVIARTTTVNVTNITVYKNVNVTNAVVGVPADRFGHGDARPAPIAPGEIAQLRPVRGALDVKPVPASLAPSLAAAPRPPSAMESRGVVATRAPRDLGPALAAQGLARANPVASPSRIVSAPPRIATAPSAARGSGRGEGEAAPPPRRGATAESVPPPPPSSPRGAAQSPSGKSGKKSDPSAHVKPGHGGSPPHEQGEPKEHH